MEESSALKKAARDGLTNWDAKANPRAPLTDNQKDAFMELATVAGNRMIPEELPVDDGSSTQTPESQLSSGLAVKDIKFNNAQQFFLWYAEIEESMMQDEDYVYRERVGQLQKLTEAVNDLKLEASAARSNLQTLRQLQTAAAAQTGALHSDCQNALARQQELNTAADRLTQKLSAFLQIDGLQAKLNSPNVAVTPESFVPILCRFDESLEILRTNPQWKESAEYLSRGTLALNKALRLVTAKIGGQLETAAAHTLAQQEQSKDNDNVFALFYGKFRACAPRVRPLIEQLEQRATDNKQYADALQQVQMAYVQQRERLLAPSVSAAVSQLASNHTKDSCTLTRRGCAFLVHVCEDEAQMYKHFFSDFSSPLHDLLLRLCDVLYDMLRPLVIHVQHLETLAELCTILKVEMLEEHVQANPAQLASFAASCRGLLEDVQERLVYRAHIYIRSDILGYKPAPGDLAYPQKLHMMQAIADEQKKKQEDEKSNGTNGPMRNGPDTQPNGSQEVENQDNKDENSESDVSFRRASSASQRGQPLPTAPAGTPMPQSPADLHGMWYPTVRRTLLCLSKMYRCVNRGTFQGISQEALSMCIETLLSASSNIESKQGWLDGRLFLIKHLLILREQISPFHSEFSVKETQLDFSKLKDAAYHLLNKRKELFLFNKNNAFLEFLFEGTPGVREEVLDSRRAVDEQLRVACFALISSASEAMVGPLERFIKQVDNLVAMRQGRELGLKNQPWATPRAVHDAVAETQRLIKQKLPTTLSAMELYLANRDTERILFKPIKTAIEGSMERLRELVDKNYSDEEKVVISVPSVDQVNLLLASGVKQK